MNSKAMVWAVGAVIGLILVANTLFMVRESTQVMVVQLGRVVRLVTEPGLNAKIPFVQQLAVFDKRILENDSPPEEVQTLDKKRLVVDSFTRWRIVNAADFFKSVRTEQVAIQRLNTIVNSGIRNVVASVNLQDLISTKRSEVMRSIVVQSAKEAKALGIEIVDVRIKRADLPPENSEAVFRRMRAERQKEAAEIRAEGDEAAQKIRADADRQRTIIVAEAERDGQKLRGEGDATAIRVGGDAFSADPSFYKLTKSLDTYKNSLRSTNTMFVIDPSSAFMDTLVNP
jgi:modulator of FtsH protease HflC